MVDSISMEWRCRRTWKGALALLPEPAFITTKRHINTDVLTQIGLVVCV